MFALIPFAIIPRDRRRDFDSAACQLIVFLALGGQSDRNDDLVVLNTVRRFVFRLVLVVVL